MVVSSFINYITRVVWEMLVHFGTCSKTEHSRGKGFYELRLRRST